MERKIGEIFEHEGEWYQCVNTGFSCADCDIKGDCSDEHIGACSGSLRTDGKAVRFKKLEKVGELFISGGKLYQHYKVFDIDNVDFEKCIGINVHNYAKKTITAEIKQNQENMEEKKLNLKPFDLEAAKLGKPVCTRDGRKARIICFDRYAACYEIVALVECRGFLNKEEEVKVYTKDGKCIPNEEDPGDLMMLPEKHEGWINIVKNKDGDYFTKGVFTSEEFARNNEANYPRVIIATVKIEWEE